MGIGLRNFAGDSLVRPSVSQSLRAMDRHVQKWVDPRAFSDGDAGDLLPSPTVPLAPATTAPSIGRSWPDLVGWLDPRPQIESDCAAGGSRAGPAEPQDTDPLAASRRIARDAERCRPEDI